MLIIFIHGWSVTNTDTYGGLPAAIQRNAPSELSVKVDHLYLSKYVSFHDEVTVDDIARGMQTAIESDVQPKLSKGERFACVTHSTGGPVTRKWIDLYYRDRLSECPIQHLVMLAPANHGSALAQLGKGRLARMKFWSEDVEPGRGVLDWLELGSEQSWDLNGSWLNYNCVSAGVYPFVLTGQSIDRQFYDNLNSYTGEAGSDGVVRVAAANMNYAMVRLIQEGSEFKLSKEGYSRKTALGILPGRSHSGKDMGIMGSVSAEDDGSHPTVRWVLACINVASPRGYVLLAKALNELSNKTQEHERQERTREVFLYRRRFVTSRYSMFIFRVIDDRGEDIVDYDVVFTAGPEYDANHLAPGFFKDRQRNQRSPAKLTYYINYDVMAEWLTRPELEGKFGFRVAARPEKGFAYYTIAEYRGTFASLRRYFEPNQTLMVEMQLKRHVAEGVFRFTQVLENEEFKNQERGADLS